MQEIFQLLIYLAITVVLNIALGMYESIGTQQFQFDVSKLVSGVIKGLIVASSFFGVTYILQGVPQLTEQFGVEPKALLYTAIGIYGAKAIKHLVGILGTSTDGDA